MGVVLPAVLAVHDGESLVRHRASPPVVRPSPAVRWHVRGLHYVTRVPLTEVMGKREGVRLAAPAPLVWSSPLAGRPPQRGTKAFSEPSACGRAARCLDHGRARRGRSSWRSCSSWLDADAGGAAKAVESRRGTTATGSVAAPHRASSP